MTDVGEKHFRRVKSVNLTIFIGLEATVFMCLIFGPNVVSTYRERNSQQAILSVIEYMCDTAMIITALTAIRYIRKREKFHRDHTVLWPSRCYHCARVLNPEGTLMCTNQENQANSDSDSAGVTNPESLSGFSSNLIQETCQEPVACHASGSNPHCLIPISTMNGNSQESCKEKSKNRALINVFSIFCFVCCTGLFIEIVRNFICYAHGDYSTTTIIAYSVTNFVIICTLPTVLSFVNAYTDAVFVDSYQNLFTAALLLSLSIWQCATRMIQPIGVLLRVRYDDDNGTLHFECQLNSTFGDVFKYIDHTVSPVYTEMSITMLVISLQLWNSFVSKTFITLENDQVNPVPIRSYYRKLSFKYLRELLLKLKISFGNVLAGACRCTRRKNETLIAVSTSPPFSKTVYIVWGLLIVANLPYLGFALYFAFRSMGNYYSYHEMCVLWSLDILFSLSFCVLCTYEKLRKWKLSQRSGKRSDSPVTKLRSHEMMLLICGIGIFCQCIFLLMAAAGILMNNQTVDKEMHLSCVIAIVYSTVKVLMMWQMTVFLIGIPRRQFDSEIENGANKRVLVCLVNVMVLCGIKWMILSLENNTFILQRLYFGIVAGEAIGVLLEPFGTIYGLHAVMMAYELYKDILSQSKG